MLFTIKKNTQNNWSIFPNSGPFSGFCIATAEAVDLTSVVTGPGKVVGAIKAVWGLEIDSSIDIFSDVETVRALCLGRAFKGYAEHPVEWKGDDIYDIDTHRILRRCKRMVLIGSHIFRRG